MPTTTRLNSGPSSSNASVHGELLWLHPDQIHPNPWNPNVVPADLLEKTRQSLARFGWLSPVVVRTDLSGWQLVDGEHRWQIAKEEGVGPIPAFCVDGLTDEEAKRATLILNDLHGQARPDKLASLLGSLLEEVSFEELQVGLPYSEDVLTSLLPDLPVPSTMVGPLPDRSPPGTDKWVERTYRLPLDAAEVLDQALTAAKGEDDIEPWQALERLAAEFLAS